MKHLLITILSFLLLSFPLFGQSEKPCYVSVTSSDDFNQTLLSNISISVISQYLKNVKPFPSSGLRGKEHCIYEVTATLDGNKTFVTLQGNNLNSFGDATIVGTDGFQQAILRSIYRSQRDKRNLICSDYPKILEECGGVVRKSAKKVVSGLHPPKKVQLEETKRKPIQVTKTKKKKDKKKPVVKTKPTKPKSWIGTLFKCQVGCLYPYWDSEGNNYDEDLNLITKGKPIEETKPKKKGNWECIVPPCDFIDEDGNLIED